VGGTDLDWRTRKFKNKGEESAINAHRTTGDPSRKQGLGKPKLSKRILSIELRSLKCQPTPKQTAADAYFNLVTRNDHPVK